MSLVIYHDNNRPNKFGIKHISDTMLKKITYNQIHKKFRFAIPKEKIETEFDTKLNTTEPNVETILMTELSSDQLNTYLELYEDESNNIDKYIEFLSIISFNQINPEKFSVKKKLDQLIGTFSEYWENYSNCHQSMTDKFVGRRFNSMYHINGLIQNEKSILMNKKIDWEAEQSDYLNDIIREPKRYSMYIKNYNMPLKSIMGCQEINRIYSLIPTEYLKYSFVSNMLCSRVHCHLILNNIELLRMLKPMFNKYKIIFKYLIGYAWISLKNEELNIYSKMTDSDRIIFDIDTANELPIFPFSFDDINQNPYASILIDSIAMDIKNNCLSIGMMKNYEKYYGVCTSNEFSRRLNIFVNGENKLGIMKNIDWSCCAITGSAMTACGMKYNPLIDIFRLSEPHKDSPNQNLTDEDLSNYYLHHYNDSDVDIMCNKKSTLDFINVVDDFINSYELDDKSEVLISKIRSSTFVVSDVFLMENMEEIKNALGMKKINFDWFKSNLSSVELKKYFYDKYYVEWKNDISNHIECTRTKLIEEYIKPSSLEDFKIVKMDYDIDSEQLNTKFDEKYFYQDTRDNNKKQTKKLIAKLCESVRYKVKFPKTKTFEIFKSRDENFFSTVSKFHMGFVRAIWNGKTVRCLPSYISAMMMQFASDYKYFVSIKDPVEIVNKYRSRGFGIILNDHEKLHMAYYNSRKIKNSEPNDSGDSKTNDNSEQNKWIELYKIDIKNKNSIKNIFGIRNSSDDIFKPSKFFMGLNLEDNCFKIPNHEISLTFDECFGSIIPPKLEFMSKFKAVSADGKINPLNKEIITLGWKLLNEK